jgi:hypothetical protein
VKLKLLSLVLFGFLSIPLTASATMSFAQTDDGIAAILSSGPCPSGQLPNANATPTVTVKSNNEIDITSAGGGTRQPLLGNLCDPLADPAIAIKAQLGKLPDGTYTVVWNFFSPQEADVVGTFAVVSGKLSSIFPSTVTGFWYDPTYSGSGFNFQMSPLGLLVTYYGWDATGNRLWLTSEIGPSSLIPNTPIALKMTYTTGGTFTDPQHNSAPWGTLTLNFASCQAAKATLSGNDGTIAMNLVILVGVPGLPGC